VSDNLLLEVAHGLHVDRKVAAEVRHERHHDIRLLRRVQPGDQVALVLAEVIEPVLDSGEAGSVGVGDLRLGQVCRRRPVAPGEAQRFVH